MTAWCSKFAVHRSPHAGQFRLLATDGNAGHFAGGTFRMAKKKTVKKQVTRAARATPAQLGRELEKLDRELVKKLGERAKLVRRLHKLEPHPETPGIGEVGINGHQRVLDSVVSLNRGPLSDQAIRAVYREILSGCLLSVE